MAAVARPLEADAAEHSARQQATTALLEDGIDSRADSPHQPWASLDRLREQIKTNPYVRRTVGICLLMTTVFLWTASNFLASVSF
jgi:hypothetical protein